MIINNMALGVDNSAFSGLFRNKAEKPFRREIFPRNVYLENGRVIKMEEVRKKLDKITGETFAERCGRIIKKIAIKAGKCFK